MYDIHYPRYVGKAFGPFDLVEAASQALTSLHYKVDFYHDIGYIPEYDREELTKLRHTVREYYQDLFDYHTAVGFLPKHDYNIIVCPSCGIVLDKDRLWFKVENGHVIDEYGFAVPLAKCILCQGVIRQDQKPLPIGEYTVHSAGTGPLSDEVVVDLATFHVGGSESGRAEAPSNIREFDTLDQIELDLNEEEVAQDIRRKR